MRVFRRCWRLWWQDLEEISRLRQEIAALKRTMVDLQECASVARRQQADAEEHAAQLQRHIDSIDEQHAEELALVDTEWTAKLDAEVHQRQVLQERVRRLECEQAVRSVVEEELERVKRDLSNTRAELEASEKVRSSGHQPCIPGSQKVLEWEVSRSDCRSHAAASVAHGGPLTCSGNFIFLK